MHIYSDGNFFCKILKNIIDFLCRIKIYAYLCTGNDKNVLYNLFTSISSLHPCCICCPKCGIFNNHAN